MSRLDTLIEQHSALLVGERRESEDSLRAVEVELGLTLPLDVRRLLLEFGYGPPNAIPNIGASVKDTMRFRRAVGLAKNYLVLDDRNDGGVVLLDTASSEGRVVWMDAHRLSDLETGEFDARSGDKFLTFLDWAMYCVAEREGEEDA